MFVFGLKFNILLKKEKPKIIIEKYFPNQTYNSQEKDGK